MAFLANDFNSSMPFPIPPIAAINAEQINGNANNFSKLIKITPKKLICLKTVGVHIPSMMAKNTLNKIKWVAYFSNLNSSIFFTTKPQIA